MESSPVQKNARTQAEWALRELERQQGVTSTTKELYSRQEVVLRQDQGKLAMVADQLDCLALSVKASMALKTQERESQIKEIHTLQKSKSFTNKEVESNLQYQVGVSRDISQECDRIELLLAEDLTLRLETRYKSLESDFCAIAKTPGIDEAHPIISAKLQATFAQEFGVANQSNQKLKSAVSSYSHQLKQLNPLSNI